MDTRSYPPSEFHGALHFAGSMVPFTLLDHADQTLVVAALASLSIATLMELLWKGSARMSMIASEYAAILLTTKP